MLIRRYIPAGLFVLFLAASARSQNFKIVVNESNPADSLTRAEVSGIFLKKTALWSNGAEAQPVDQKAPSAVREEFTKAVHGRSLSAVQSYWRQQIFSGRSVPPQEVTGDRAVLEWVQNNPGGIGYISAAAPVADFTVKSITLKE
jgi:ABC-type phosphate transport system substrate-binding protein